MGAEKWAEDCGNTTDAQSHASTSEYRARGKKRERAGESGRGDGRAECEAMRTIERAGERGKERAERGGRRMEGWRRVNA